MQSTAERGTEPSQGGWRTKADLAGVLATAAALGISEVLSAALAPGSSLIVAVADLAIDKAPAPVEDFAISLFGIYDKQALILGILTVSALFGIVLGRVAVRRFPLAAAGFVGFGVLGAHAASRALAWTNVEALITAAVSAATGIAALAALTVGGPATEESLEQQDLRRNRRAFLIAAGAVAGVAVLGAAGGRALLKRAQNAVAATREALSLPRAAQVADPPGLDASFDVAGLEPIVVPNDDFYRIDTAVIVPRVDPVDWRLSITGMVDRPYELTFGELLTMPLVERYVTLACVSNTVGGGLVGNALWLGVPLTEILDRARPQDGATQIVGRSVDGFTVGFPTEAVFDGREALVAVGMNGEPLPFNHGFPARLVVAGLYGYVSATKWLEEIELTTLDAFDAYWIPRGWAKEAPIKLQSRIDVPDNGARVDAGTQVAAGVAWAPNNGISKVELRIDEGPWEEATVSSPLSKNSWVQWRHEFEATGIRQTLTVRATDAAGLTQTEENRPARPDGATGHHSIRLRPT